MFLLNVFDLRAHFPSLSFIFQWKARSCITVPLLWPQGEDWSLLLCEFEPLPLWDYCWMKNLTKHKLQIVILTSVL